MAATKILLPNGDYVPAQSFTQDGQSTKAQEIVICDASGNVVGVTSNRLDVSAKAAQATASTDTITGALQTGKAPLDVTGYSTVTVTVSGTHAGVSIALLGYADGGTLGVQIPLRNLATGAVHIAGPVITANAVAIFQADVAGLNYVTVTSGSYTSGTANLRVVASAAPTAGTAGVVGPARSAVSYYAVAAAAGTTGTETAITLTRSLSAASTSTGTSFTVPLGKRFRIAALSVATRGHSTATIQTTTFNLRFNTSGAVGTTSTPIVFSARSATAAVASAWDRVIIPVPDGFEIPGDGALQFGLTAAATYTTNAPTWDVNILGFEY